MEPEIEAALRAFDAAIEADSRSDAPWHALQALARGVVGAKLFTVMTIDLEKGVARRAFTSDPASYPASGTKPIHRDAWFDTIHDGRRPFVANTLAEIAEVFPDHGLIGALGCGSVLNLPVFIGGVLRGTVNCLDAEHHYAPARVERARALAIPVKLAFALADPG